MPYRLTQPHENLGDDAKPGYAEYGPEEAPPKARTARRSKANAKGHAGSYGQHDFGGAAQRSARRSDQRYHDSASEKGS